MAEGLLTTNEAANLLKVRVDEIYRLRRSGQLEAIRDDGRWLFPVATLEKRLEQRARAKKAKNGESERVYQSHR